MSCQHCVRSITNALSALTGVSDVSVSLDTKQVSVVCTDSVSRDTLVTAIEDEGFDVD